MAAGFAARSEAPRRAMRSPMIGATAISPMSVGVAAAGVAMRRVPSPVRVAWVSPRAIRAAPAILAADGSRDGPEAATGCRKVHPVGSCHVGAPRTAGSRVGFRCESACLGARFDKPVEEARHGLFARMVFRVPLHAQHKRGIWALDGLDYAVRRDGARGIARAEVSNRLMVERIHGELALAEDTSQHASAFDLDCVRNSSIHIFVMDDSEGSRCRRVLRIEIMVERAPVSDVHNLCAATYAENRQPSPLCTG